MGKRGAVIVSGERFSALLRGEADRGCVLVAQELIDDVLECGLSVRFMVNGLTEKESRRLLDNGKFALLGGFSARIELARAFGVIDKPTYKSLDALRNVRNSFAHYPEISALTGDHIAQMVSEFHQTIRDALEAEFSRMQKAVVEELGRLLQGIYDPKAALFSAATPRKQFEVAAFALFLMTQFQDWGWDKLFSHRRHSDPVPTTESKPLP